jgi:DNA-binding IclR family transcriptional regulator
MEKPTPMSETQETRPPSTALVEEVLERSDEPMTAQEIANWTRVANTTVWRGVNSLRESGDIVPVETQPLRWQLH